jgi:hypothetical protein
MMLAALLLLTRFVTPGAGAQTIGPQWIEITTDAASVDRVEFTIDGTLAGVARNAPWKIPYDFGSSLAGHTIKATVYSNGYKSTETASITTQAISAGEVLNVDLVEVPLRARASHDLKPADVRVRENGVNQVVRQILAERGPAHFVFVVDRSLSMDEGRLEAALHAIDDELHMLRPDDKPSIVLFNHNFTRARGIGTGDKVAAIFGDVVPSGGTSLYDAMASIVSTDRTYAIVITDGGDRNSELSSEEALRRVSNTHTVVHGIILGRSSDFVSSAAKNTGGDVMRATAETLDAALRDTIADINSRYLLIYQSHGTKRGWRTIDVKPAASGVSILKARQGYFAE